MIDALNIASQGLLQAERRATDAAREIVKSTSQEASFSTADPDTPAQNTGVDAAGAPVSAPTGAGFSSLLQHMVDLKAETQAFQANAAAFKRLDETYDDALGALVDDQS
jgi:flagellar basal body rod protein FlgC